MGGEGPLKGPAGACWPLSAATRAGLPEGFCELAGEILVKDLVLVPGGAGGGGLEGARGGRGGGSSSSTVAAADLLLPAGYQEVRCRLLIKACPEEGACALLQPRPLAGMF
jgi:hypothetical protein